MKYNYLVLIVLVIGINACQTYDENVIKITDVAREQKFYVKKNSGGYPNHFRMQITSNIDSEAMLQIVHYVPVSDRNIKIQAGEKSFLIVQDWYPDTLTLIYYPKSAQTGSIKINWSLY